MAIASEKDEQFLLLSHFYLLLGQFFLKLLLNSRYRHFENYCPIIESGTVNIKKSLTDQNFSSAIPRPFIANQFRLLLSQAAYILMLRIRQAAKGTEFATAQVERLRSMLIKGAAKVTTSARRVLVELSNYCPFAQEIKQITQQLGASEEVFV